MLRRHPQRTKLDAYITSQDNMVAVADYEEYASSKDIEGRPQLLRLLEDAADGKFDTVLVDKIDRWSRRLADLLATVEFLDRHDIASASATEPIDTTSPLGRLFLQILGSFAEFERGLIVERVTRGIEAKRNAGLPLAAVGFGLRKKADGVVEKDPVTFPVVERIFRYYTCVTSRRFGKATCSAPSLPADDLERLVGEALVNTYADTDLFAGAVAAHIAQGGERTEPLESELVTVRSSIATKERLLNKYRSDYEADRLDADLYNSRTHELRTEVTDAKSRATELVGELAAAQEAPAPTDENRAALHAVLAKGIHTAPIAIRKALFTALVERLEVHAADDVRPTFRLGAPDLGIGAGNDEPAAADVAEPGSLLFAYRGTGWS